MTQEDKELLLKDLCARLPYNIKAMDYEDEPPFTIDSYDKSDFIDDDNWIDSDGWNHNITKTKPYLFPMSSMTEEQKDYIRNRFCYDWDGEPYDIWRHQIDIEDADELIDWFNKNHFDFRGLIPKGLAIDATGKNIY